MQDLTFIKSWTPASIKAEQNVSTIEVFKGDNGLWFRCGAITGTVSANVTAGADIKISLCENSERQFYMLHLDKGQAPEMSF